MTKTMLVDATHPEETRVAIVEGSRLSDFDFERTSKKQLKGNIYLAKVIRVEPSLQAAFVEYGGNRHGFLPFSEIHPDYFRIPIADRPHDEPAPEDDASAEGEEQDTSDDISAYAEEQEIVAESNAAPELIGREALAVQQEQIENTIEAYPPISETSPIADFTHDSSHDLGLITDFGNAVVSAPLPESEIAPIETVGGEPAEESQREARQYRPRYKIQEVVKRRQVMLIQVVKEERGNKGAALTTFLSLAGRYCVLMPNTDHGGGVSRKITSHQDRRRMKEMLDQLEVPEGMAVILRTAGMEQEPAEIQRDLEYLLRLWNSIREQTLQSTAPAMIYEEANLIKRSLRDLYSNDLDCILVAGDKGYQLANDFMRTIMPDSLDKIKPYADPVPLFLRYNVEKQIDLLYNPVVQLRSGGYIVINPTEALVSIDVNSGRATRERHIESTALKTNLEAAEEIARQLRLRDLAGLIVIDFIDMEDGRNNAAVERRMKEAMKNDRARLQIGRISPFGLLELSRQRIHSSLMEINFEKCPHCAGIGLIRSVDSAAISLLRVIEEDAIKSGGGDVTLHVQTQIALYVLNQKRGALSEIEKRYNLQVLLHCDDSLAPADHRLERSRSGGARQQGPAVNTEQVFADTERDLPPPAPSYSEATTSDESVASSENNSNPSGGFGGGGRRRGGGRFGGQGRGRDRYQDRQPQPNPTPVATESSAPAPADYEGQPVAEISGNPNTYAPSAEGQNHDQNRRGGRRRGRRGGRGRHGGLPRESQDGHYQPQNSNNNWEQAPPPVASIPQPVAAVSIPVSIHDIDTTPRPHNAPVVSPVASSADRPPQRQQPAYHVIEESSDKPKGGWWRRLTGQ